MPSPSEPSRYQEPTSRFLSTSRGELDQSQPLRCVLRGAYRCLWLILHLDRPDPATLNQVGHEAGDAAGE